MRLFIGIPLGAAVTAALSAFIEPLRSPGDGLRWAATAGWHITLQFLGNTTAEKLACIVPRLKQIRFQCFTVRLERPGFFDRSGVFYIDVPVSPELRELQRLVTTGTAPCGFTPEDRPYHPHLTLARTGAGGKGFRQLNERIDFAATFPAFTAREFVLYESFLQPAGSRFEVRERFTLNDAA